MTRFKFKKSSHKHHDQTNQPASARQNHQAPLRRSLIRTLKRYPSILRGMLVATFWPVLIISGFRYFSDDYTGNQYSVIIGLISIFTTLLIARVAVVGWDWRQTKLPTLYSQVMGRYISGIGLMMLLVVHALPLIGGLLLLGFSFNADVSRWLLVTAICLLLLGTIAFAMAGFAPFAFMEDLSLTIWQSYRVSIKLAQRYWRVLWWRIIIALIGFLAVIVGLVYIGQFLSPYLQDPVVGLVFDALSSWLITPLIIFYIANIFQALVQDYE